MDAKKALMRKKKDALANIIIGKTETNGRLKKELDDSIKELERLKKDSEELKTDLNDFKAEHLISLKRLHENATNMTLQTKRIKLNGSVMKDYITESEVYFKAPWYKRIFKSRPIIDEFILNDF